MINETRKHPHYYKIEYTYSVLTAKLSHTKTQEKRNNYKNIILTAQKQRLIQIQFKGKNIRIESTRI